MAADNRARRKEIAESTLKAIENGSFILDNRTYLLTRSSALNTHLYNSSDLSKWSSTSPDTSITRKPQIYILEISTLEAARLLSSPSATPNNAPKVGVLNFASAKKPGGGFLSGAQAQEESIARSSTVYQSLTSAPAAEFYSSHKRDARGGYYSHAMIWSPDVTVFRDDEGGWIQPFIIEVVTSPAVNAGVVRKHISDATQEEKRIESVMKERMARILFVFESKGVPKLVLGSFGTGVFQNSVPMIARLWAQLLCLPGSRFASSFETVVFGVLSTHTYEEFKAVFEQTCREGSNG